MSDRIRNGTPSRAPARRRGAMVFRMIVMLVIFGATAGSVYAFRSFTNAMGAKYMASMRNPPQIVSTTQAAQQPWQEAQSAVGSVRAVNGTDLAFETAGIIDKLNFRSGDDVQAGAVIAVLRADDVPGRIEALRAQEQLAEITLGRDRKQFTEKAVAQATLDTDTANLRNLKAQIAQQQALLDERVIRAPFAGRLGIRQVDLGQYVGAGTTVVTLQSLDPIFADFFLPQQSVHLLQAGSPVKFKVDAYPNTSFAGEIAAVNPKIDVANRNVQIRATLRNPEHKLLPGMYGSVEIASGGPRNFLTVPQTAISFNPYGNTVYVVTDKDEQGNAGQFVRQAFVKTGETRGDQIQILSGINAGDRIVTSGQTKLHNGTPVKIDDRIQPASDSHPEPQE